jgi:hypothetical protein
MEPRSGNQMGRIADSFCNEPKGLRPEIALNQGFRAEFRRKIRFPGPDLALNWLLLPRTSGCASTPPHYFAAESWAAPVEAWR